MTTSTTLSAGLNPPPAASDVAARRAALQGIVLAVGCGFVYLLITGSFRFDFKQTDHPHHILMADAMLHGQLNIRPEALRDLWAHLEADAEAQIDEAMRATGETVTPEQRAIVAAHMSKDKLIADWALVGDKFYGYWAPLTPAVMMPFVALFGIGVSDGVIAALFGALNIGLFYWLLWRVDRIGLCCTTASCRVALTLLLAFGTTHFWMTCSAQSWFAIQIVTLTAMLAALVAACAPSNSVHSCAVSGFFFGAAILGRNIVVLAGLFFPLLMWLRLRETGQPWLAAVVRRAIAFGVPVAIAIAVQGVYNDVRFGSPFESGLAIQVKTGGQGRFAEPFKQYGAFSLHYLAHNFKYYFWNVNFPHDADGTIWVDYEGNSMFLVTPPLLYAFLAWRGNRRFALALLCGVVPLLVALLLYFATGVVQFGPRYLLDVMPLMLLLVALGMRGRLTHVGYVLVVLAIAVNLFGVYRFVDYKFVAIQPWVTWLTLPGLVGLALLMRILVTVPALHAKVRTT